MLPSHFSNMAINKKYLIAGSIVAVCIAISFALLQGNKPMEKVMEQPVAVSEPETSPVQDSVPVKEEIPVVETPVVEEEEEKEEKYGYTFNLTVCLLGALL